jgi:hydroxyquinol 1,2-dioxygenase
MRNFDEFNITQAVLDRVSGGTNPRVRQISEALVRHLHDFVREVEPTQAEWEAGISFLTRVGKMCDANRQEFILLSDVLGVSMLVDAINHRLPAGATETTVLGPFYVQQPPVFELGADVAGNMQGMPLFVDGSVATIDGTPIGGARVDIWHADAEGEYDVQQEGGLAGRARFEADDEGRFHFWTIRPAFYPIPNDGPVGEMLAAQGRHPFRPAHVHFMIAAPGCETLVTHVFADGDKYLDTDVVFGVKDSIIRPYVEHSPGTAPDGRAMDKPFAHLHYDFRLKASA